MSQCSIYFPGLLGPDVPVEALAKKEWPGNQQLPFTARLLSRGHYTKLTKADFETRVLNGMGIMFDANHDVPIARLRSQHIAQFNPEKRIWCLDPVFIQIDKEDAVACAHESIDLSESEALHLIDDLNTHFNEDGFKLYYHSEHRWLLEADLELTTVSLSSVMHQNISYLQPGGEHEKRWRTLLNEIQMLLYNHPVNQARELRGEMPVNSVWLWGGGQAEQYEPIVNAIICDEPWVNDLAQLYEINVQACNAFTHGGDLKAPMLLVYSAQLEAIRKNDVFAWIDSLKDFEAKILSVVMQGLQDKTFDHLTVYSDTVSISLDRKSLKKWWQRIKPVRDLIIQARHDYGL